MAVLAVLAMFLTVGFGVAQGVADEPAAPGSQPLAAAPPGSTLPPAGPGELVAGTPCTSEARACVDILGKRAWLIANGRVVRGPVANRSGDQEDPTPRGTFEVEWKAERWTSRQYLVQMPYSVFFAPGGIAFHEGNHETPSAGCVKLTHDDAVAFFDFLAIGDEVQVH